MTQTEEEQPGGDEQQPIGAEAEDVFTPEVLKLMLTLNEDEMICPLRLKRTDVNKVKAVKLSEAEVQKVNTVTAYLHDRGFIPDPTFASLFVYCFNMMYHYHSKAAEQEAREEVAP
ncbi:hypothetical protein LCGC14_1355130 [marine sediment metagenome]|uniref:Uncharacterized protein n=1 Tax=marine sediment metagenome TaxID=412755 RepID=A0A0F9KVX5_9ZZZZ